MGPPPIPGPSPIEGEGRRCALTAGPRPVSRGGRAARPWRGKTTMAKAAGAPVELTLRGLVIGGLITTVFTAANVFFGLKAGLTFASSIPATVISMAVLRELQDLHHPGEQHRADGGVRRRHLVVDHLRAAGAGHGRLVDGLSVLGLLRHLRLGRDPGGDVLDPAAAGARHRQRPALPRGRGLRRGAQGRRRARGRRPGGGGGGQGGAPGGAVGLHRLGRLRAGGVHQAVRRQHRPLRAGGRGGDGVQPGALHGAPGRGPPGGAVGGRGHAHRRAHRLAGRGALADRPARARRRSARRPRRLRRRGVPLRGAAGGRGRDRRGRHLDAGQAGGPHRERPARGARRAEGAHRGRRRQPAL